MTGPDPCFIQDLAPHGPVLDAVVRERFNPGGARNAFLARLTGRRTVPQIFIGARHVGGYDELADLEFAGKLDPLLAPR